VKVCLMTSEAPYIGGSSTSAWCLFKKLKEKGLDAHLMIPSEPQIGFRPSGDGVHIIEMPALAHMPLIDLYVDVREVRRAQKTAYLLETYSALSELQPTVIHTHDVTTLRFAAAWMRSNPKAKLVHSFGSCQSVYLYVRSSLVNSEDIRELRFPRYRHPEETILIHEPDYVVVKSRLELRIAHKLYGLKDVSNLYNGVDTNFFNTDVTEDRTFLEKLGVENEHVIMSVAGNISKPEKGLDLVVRALPSIKEKVPDICYVIVGRVKPHKELEFGTQQKLLNIIDKLGVKDNVRFLGNFLPQDIAKLYKASLVFLDPSIYGPINTANLEALACGTPVICSKSIGTGEIISACDAGFVVDRDPKSWAKLVVKLINDEKLAIEMGRRGSRMILDEFSWDKISEKYLEIYRKVTREAS
jgi:glycosyltransferase involved in cell wall biosynthesis